MAVEPQVLAQVGARAEEVRSALRAGITATRGKFLGGMPAAEAAKALESLRGPIDAWAKRGDDAARTGLVPSANGWPGWLKAGETFVAGINDITKLGLDANLDNITTAVAEIPDDVKRVAKKAAQVIKDATDTVSKAAGSAAWDLVKPLLLPLGLIAVGLVAFAVIRSRGL